MKRVILIILLIVFLPASPALPESEDAGFGKAWTPPEPTAVQLESLKILPSKETIYTGRSMQFLAVGDFTDFGKRELTSMVKWSSSDENTVVISEEGLATGGALRGWVTISASFGNKTASARLKVIPPQLGSITITPLMPLIGKGMKQQFSATGHYSDNTSKDITSLVRWESYNNDFVTIDSAGLATGLTEKGAATITATHILKRASTKIIVTPKAVVSISINPDSATIFKESMQFTAAGNLADHTTLDMTSSVNWTSSDPDVVQISQYGLATALTCSGTATIKATYNYKTGTAVLTVVPRLVSIDIAPANNSIQQMEIQQFKAIGILEDTSTQDLTSAVRWISQKPSVARINEKGLATGIRIGTSPVSATYKGKAASASMTVLLKQQRATSGRDDSRVLANEGRKWPSPRFSSLNETGPAPYRSIIDHLTGLMWTVDSESPGPAVCGPAETKTNKQAIQHVACLNLERYLGYDDWRLPDQNELFSLIDYQQTIPVDSVYTHGFSYVQLFHASDYWLAPGPNFTGFADLRYGIVYKSNDNSRSYVWPVRTAERAAERVAGVK